MTNFVGLMTANHGENPRDMQKAKYFVNDRVLVCAVGGQPARGPFIVDSIENGQFRLRDSNRELVDGGCSKSASWKSPVYGNNETLHGTDQLGEGACRNSSMMGLDQYLQKFKYKLPVALTLF